MLTFDGIILSTGMLMPDEAISICQCVTALLVELCIFNRTADVQFWVKPQTNEHSRYRSSGVSNRIRFSVGSSPNRRLAIALSPLDHSTTA